MEKWKNGKMEKWIKNIYCKYFLDNKNLDQDLSILEWTKDRYIVPNWKSYNSRKLSVYSPYAKKHTLQECIDKMGKNGKLD